ncbi:MAG TPA: polymer-forming cytoskeletal protein [Bacteroidales bacterium]|jgi:cytoskeletal protein CcmA (bactofilin family)|nr:polymer-forming cytoskeletal protein [Bacteroidales bacterium]
MYFCGSIETIMAKEVAATNTTVYSVIAVGTRIKGTIDTDNDIRLDGQLIGDMKCQGKLIMGGSSYLKGTINCVNAEILGKAEADLDVKDVLILRSQSSILGNIKTSTLVIEPGAVFNGTCSMVQPTAETNTDE